MNRKEVTKTFMMISNWIKPFGFHSFYKNNSALQGFNKIGLAGEGLILYLVKELNQVYMYARIQKLQVSQKNPAVNKFMWIEWVNSESVR